MEAKRTTAVEWLGINVAHRRNEIKMEAIKNKAVERYASGMELEWKRNEQLPRKEMRQKPIVVRRQWNGIEAASFRGM